MRSWHKDDQPVAQINFVPMGLGAPVLVRSRMDLDRYHRQMLLPEIGEEGQRRLVGSRALLVGCGALGCAIADLLVRAGVGELTIIDRDVVEKTNLQRQVLYDEGDARAALPKAEAAAKRLGRVNSGVRVRPLVADFTHENAEELLGQGGVGRGGRPGVLLDGTDNFLARYLLNDLAVKHGIPYVYGGAVAVRGMAMTVVPGAGPCLRCLFPEPPPGGVAGGGAATCDTAGILGPVAAVVGAIEAAEAIKVLIGRADLCTRGLLELDLWSERWRRLVGVAADPACVCCAQRRFEFLEGKMAQEAAVICTRTDGGSVQVRPSRESAGAALDLEAIAQRLRAHGEFTVNQHLLRGVLEREPSDGGYPIVLTLFRDGRAVVKGTTEVSVARGIYARYIGA
jgi:adenylyltransferase/sulfurtransferase